MNTIHFKKGFTPNIAGAPKRQLHHLERPRQVGLIPQRIPFVKPRLLVAEGDPIAAGSPVFEDKRNPRIRFASPGGGRVTRIRFGPRRVIEQIVIALDDEEPADGVAIPSGEWSRHDVVECLLAGGMWPFLRSLPFMDVADPDVEPPAIIVRLGNDEPFSPDPRIYLDGWQDQFALGIDALMTLCPQVVINATIDDPPLPSLPDTVTYQRLTGRYPAGNPSVQLYLFRSGPEQNRSWYIDGQAVALLGEFLRSGRYPVRRVMAVGGSLAPINGHVVTRAGVPLKALSGAGQERVAGARHIVGGVFTGYTSSADSFMGFYQNALNLIDDGDREEPFGFIRPGYGKPSYSTAFLSSVRRRPFPMDCSQHGEERACVNCGTCAAICPVDILPQFTMKCLVADEVEEALAHGLLDCAECGLCTYACPSKIKLRKVLRAAKGQYYKETA